MGKGNTVTIGTTQSLHIGKFACDRRGLITGSVQRKVRENFDEVNFGLLKIYAAPPMLVPCVGVEREFVLPHGVYTYTYEGIDPDQVDDERLITFELNITMEEVSMEAHPNLAEIERKYGKFDPRLRRFTQRYITSADGDDLEGGDSSGSKRRNPLFGTDSFLSFGATFKRSYVRRVIPASALRGIGTIISRPLGVGAFKLPKAAKHRKWLKLAPHLVKRGNSVQIEENYIMAGRHGIVKEVYGAAALSEEDDSGSSGGGSSLTTS